MSQALLRYEWDTIDWRKLEKNVYKLQNRIYKAVKRGDKKLARSLQRLMLKSVSAKLLAVRKVSQDNRGKKTAGVDGKLALTYKERLEIASEIGGYIKPLPTRRVWIPKPGKKEKRPLGIPAMVDRAQQALFKLGLEPEWEARFEPNSYGFRPGRSAHDAIEAIFNQIRYKSKYVLDADIAGCFDNIDQQYLLNKLDSSTLVRKQVKSWLKSGVVDANVFQTTPKGTPQGGVISPLLANIALHGMEEEIRIQMAHGRKGRYSLAKTPAIIRYADDFVCIHENLEIVQTAQSLIATWLEKVGLEIKPEKTRLCHTLETFEGEHPGFDFLGFTVRQFKVGAHNSGKNTNRTLLGFKTVIKPSKKSTDRHYRTLRDAVRVLRGAPQKAVIRTLNPMVRGWANYYSTVISRKTFERLGDLTHHLLWKWSKFRHPHKGEQWIKRKYFQIHGGNRWRFMDKDGKFLMQHQEHPIRRHTKVKGLKSPFDGDLMYWATRMGRHPEVTPRVARLMKAQKGKCGCCGHYFRNEDIAEVHHVDGDHANNCQKNLKLIHGHCHDQAHSHKEPNQLRSRMKAKDSRPVLKSSQRGDPLAEIN